MTRLGGAARRVVPREEQFTSPLRSPSVTARVGLWLGLCFAVAFITGLLSHAAQSPTPWFPLPTRPSWGYRVTQGLHVISGTAAVPLLLVKLWTVFPKLFARVPLGARERALTAAERGSIAVLVASSVFMLASGLANAAQWYPWAFSFRATHFALGWVAVGALLVHIAVKLPVIREALAGPLDDPDPDPDLDLDLDAEPERPDAAPTGVPDSAPTGALSRRALLRTTWVATGAAVVLSAGSTVPQLRQVSLFGTRSGAGPGGIPINKSAAAAGVVAAATDPAWRLVVTSAAGTVELSRSDLEAMPQVSAQLPIACVEGWSASGRWTGVTLATVLALVEHREEDVRAISLQQDGPFSATTVPVQWVHDPSTLLALRLDGDTLALDHGYPVRLIAPNRPGVLQTKWLSRLEVVA